MHYSEYLHILINELKKMPGIGEKTAERLAFYIVKTPKNEIEGLYNSIKNAKQFIMFCKECFNISDSELCSICSSTQRDKSKLCIVEQPNDMWAIENSGSYNGIYHILHGSIAPLDNIKPDDLTIRYLKQRIEENKFDEVIIATNPTIEGDTTALYLLKIFENKNLKITQIARGVPSGSSLTYATKDTISEALGGRKSYYKE